MAGRKRKKQSPAIVTCRRGLACLSLIWAAQLMPQNVLADDSAAQVNPSVSAAQIELTDSAVQADPADAAVQINTADSAEAFESLPECQMEETVLSVPAEDAASFDGESTQESVPEASGSDADVCAAAPDNTVTGDDQTSDDADMEETQVPTLTLQREGDSPAAESEYPSRFDLRDLGRVTPVKLQSPWGSGWVFSATAAAESSILTKMDSTYVETGLDLSEKYLAWYIAQSVTENISTSQAGEGLHLYDENPNNIYLYSGKEKCAGTLYAQGIGPVPESEYPYRGLMGNLAYETMLADREACIEDLMAQYRQIYTYASDDSLRSLAEKTYEEDLSRFAVYDAYSKLDDWTISEYDEPGSGKLRGASCTLIDNNVFIYWVQDSYDGIDEFGKEPLAVISADFSEDRLLYQDSIDQIKGELNSGRGVSVEIKWNDESLNEETWAQYYNGNPGATSHSVCIVGWDDDYDASCFSIAPPGNGAWIVKNSFGSQTDMIPGGLVAPDGTTRDANGGDWGIIYENGLHTGYFYLSYYDEGIGSPESFDFDLRENHDQENALQLDYMPAASDEWVNKSESPIWCANVFTLDKDMRIDEVAARFSAEREAPLTGFTVTFDIYRLSDGAAAPDDGELLASCTHEFRNYGYHRVALDAPVYSKAGERLAVVVRQRHNYEDGSAKYFATSQISLSYTSNPQFRRGPLYGSPIVNKGESFLKIEGVTEEEEAATQGWLDLCAPFSRNFLWYLMPELADNAAMADGFRYHCDTSGRGTHGRRY